ncbi:unnamed protein product [Rotaria sp. Silwood1]|nr:unnamed protein product [Rotaria sp. Silwood1]CAF1407733.1 unnamed protein product [Rotaria sp. Silwood1]
MAPHISFIASGLLLVIFTIVVQSVPIDKTKDIAQPSSIKNKQVVNHHLHKFIHAVETTSSSTGTTTNPTTTVSQSSLSTSTVTPEITNKKKKRYIDDDDNDALSQLLDSENYESDELDSSQLPYFKHENIDNNIGHKLYAKVEETAATIHDNADKPVDTDDSKTFSDIMMTPSELTDIVRRRRDVKLNDELNTRRKRAISPYSFYDTDSLYDPYVDMIDGYPYVRPTRSFAPLYWYPSVYQRNIRSALAPSFYESSEYPTLYSTTIDNNNDDDDDSPVPIFNNDIEDNNEFETNRYPILLQLSNNPLDDIELPEQYNEDVLPIDEDIEEIFNESDMDDSNDDDNNDDDDDDDDDDENDNEAQYRLIFQRKRPYYVMFNELNF